MIAEATMDAHDEEERLAGFHSVLVDELQTPFQTVVLGVEVTVADVDLLPGRGLVAWCLRGGHRQAIALPDLPLPDPPPAGAEWIAAYRHWCR